MLTRVILCLRVADDQKTRDADRARTGVRWNAYLSSLHMPRIVDLQPRQPLSVVATSGNGTRIGQGLFFLRDT